MDAGLLRMPTPPDVALLSDGNLSVVWLVGVAVTLVCSFLVVVFFLKRRRVRPMHHEAKVARRTCSLGKGSVVLLRCRHLPDHVALLGVVLDAS